MIVLGQNGEENNCLRHKNISAPLDGTYGSKAVDKTLLEVSSKIGEAKSKKELEFFQRHGFWLWPRTWRASYTFSFPLSQLNIRHIPDAEQLCGFIQSWKCVFDQQTITKKILLMWSALGKWFMGHVNNLFNSDPESTHNPASISYSRTDSALDWPVRPYLNLCLRACTHL